MERNWSWSRGVIHGIFLVLSIAIIAPMWLVVSASLTAEEELILSGYSFFPQEFSMQGYEVILQYPVDLIRAYGVTILVTIAGTLASILLTAMTGYVLARKDFRYRRMLTFYVFFTMIFSSGLVPFYMLVTKYLHIKDTVWALIIPYLLNPFYVLIMKGFMDKLPHEMIESGKVDGAGEWRMFFQLILPLSAPALATVSLFISFAYWNDWWLGLLFIDNEQWVPLQLLLYRTMSSIEFIANNAQYVDGLVDLSKFPSMSARMALAIVGAGPMMFIFPLFRRFFVTGLTIGSLKE